MNFIKIYHFSAGAVENGVLKDMNTLSFTLFYCSIILMKYMHFAPIHMYF